MFVTSSLDVDDKNVFYEQLLSQVKALIDGERNLIANLSNISALLNVHLDTINWVGFYLWSEQDQQLILGPFQGLPACIRIAPGRGVCGTAVSESRTMVVEDVRQFPGHIACDAASQSEVVVPLIADGQVIGVLDIDSPVTHRFDDRDAKGLELIASILVQGSDIVGR